MSDSAVTIFVVDDDPMVLRALSRLLRVEGYQVREYSSPEMFLAQHDSNLPGCAILDLSMPGLSGLELQQALAADGERPVIFITGHGDVPSSVQAMKAGAVDFLMKPFSDAELLGAVAAAVQRDLHARAAHAERFSMAQLLAALTPREHEVLQHVVAGRINKQIAADLGPVEKTIKVHRARIMDKMKVHSVAELTRLCERAGVGTLARMP